MPGFYLPADERDGQGLTVWEPVTAGLDYGRWPAAAYFYTAPAPGDRSVEDRFRPVTGDPCLIRDPRRAQR
ncbi:hypothetical protein [Nocardia sp. NPDC058497]|uniref:hypothetical protein n=1 Tax=Nocardia sp. NPDC058497 TaxID=3346529 RepID=UPI003662B280